MKSASYSAILCFIFLLVFEKGGKAQTKQQPFRVIAYYAADTQAIDQFEVGQLTHIIYSFCHLKGNKLNVDDGRDSATIKKLVSLKQNYPRLKILLSLGGWGGCKTCSDVFSTQPAREEFASSVRALADYFGTDGIDLDWEYPTIAGHPGHPYKAEDKEHFTALVQALRASLGNKQEISFAAGGFKKYLEESVDWKKVMAVADYVNLMTYDLVNGATPHTGHHTPLYSTAQQQESADACVNFLDSIGVPKSQLVIGAAFYGRSWTGVEPTQQGLYQPGDFKSFMPYRNFANQVSEAKGFRFYYDSVAHASYAYNAKEKVFATFDDRASIEAKTKYALRKGLGGIMFWELSLDKPADGLLNVISQAVKSVK
ncbi:glycoside hydrolase family 18 protein [Niabella insulamsoli]|uniref:glycoside hydrolase family 18 protein n=1 Tax=Niabella insulamsoli TaxID=3144874 RepID=UPI0031FC08A6